MPAAGRISYHLAREFEYAIEESPVLRGELIVLLAILTNRKRGFFGEVRLDIASTALHEVLREATPVRFAGGAGQVIGQVSEAWIQKGEQRAECLALAAVRCGSNQDQMTLRVLRESFEEFVALMFA